jgi:hypothetical protein
MGDGMGADGSRAAELVAARVGVRGGLGADRRAALADAWRALWISRLVVWAAGVGAVAIWGLMGRHRAFDPTGLTDPFGRVGDALVAPASRWDATWYLGIAHSGYAHDPARPAFFPLYPLLVRVAGAVTGSDLVGAILVSLACFAAALYVLRRLTAIELGEDAARAAVLLCALFPMAFFFSAVYSESLFLALSLGCVYAARTDRWAWAGTLGALATGTRSAGILLVVPLVLLALRGRRRPGPEALWIALVPAGLLAFCGYLALRGGSATAPFHAQAVWFRSFAWPFAGVWDGTVAAWDGLRQLLSGSRSPVYFTQAGGDPFNVAWHNLTLWAFLVAVVPALAGVLRRLPAAYGAYTVAALALPLSYPVTPQPLMSFPRFVAVLFPLFMWGGWWVTRPGHPWRAPATYVLSAAGLIAFAAQFATWHWVA